MSTLKLLEFVTKFGVNSFDIDMPKDAQLIGVTRNLFNDHLLTFTALCDPQAPLIKRKFQLVTQEDEFPATWWGDTQLVGSIAGCFGQHTVVHVLEIDLPRGRDLRTFKC